VCVLYVIKLNAAEACGSTHGDRIQMFNGRE